MKYCNKLFFTAIASVFLMSCAEESQLDFDVLKPDSIAKVEYLDQYDVLKSYVDRTANPNFKLGAGVSLSEFVSRGPVYGAVATNFDEITAGYEMKHGAVVGKDGKLDLSGVKDFIKAATAAKVTIYGHTLCWHSNQNATYLNGLIAPTVIPGSSSEPKWETITTQDFESSTASNYSFNATAQTSFTAAGTAKDGTRAFKITNASVRTNDWDVQLFVTMPRAVKAGEKWRFTMDIKSDVNASYPTQAHTAPGAYKHWDFFGTLGSTTAWTTYTKEITVSTNQDGCNTIAFNLGKTATSFYFDNVKVEYYNLKPVNTVEKTAEEKRQLIDAALDAWIKGMLTEAKGYVKAWDVVNEPMSDYPDPSLLKTGIGKKLAADEFYWQDYLGKDYAVRAIQLARQYGNATDKLFINDYGLESDDQLKCQGLINYVQYVESKGVKVDGIGTQMHVTLGVTKIESIRAMFTKLAATGKLIKVSELDMGMRLPGASTNLQTAKMTNAQLQQMGDFYEDIVKAYFELIPAAQRYGITQWALTDSPDAATAWRSGEPIGLWTDKTYKRKHAYAGFANGLAGKKVFARP